MSVSEALQFQYKPRQKLYFAKKYSHMTDFFSKLICQNLSYNCFETSKSKSKKPAPHPSSNTSNFLIDFPSC